LINKRDCDQGLSVDRILNRARLQRLGFDQLDGSAHCGSSNGFQRFENIWRANVSKAGQAQMTLNSLRLALTTNSHGQLSTAAINNRLRKSLRFVR